jgi:peptide-methionine (R)-S-oxide reductase
MSKKIEKSEAEWQSCLTPEQFRIMRQQGTERAFTGKYHDCKTAGTYVCAACGEPLFDSESKFDSGTGWPSYWQPVDEKAVATHEDNTHGMHRIEVHCRKCGSHLGHVFPDGPAPTGLRYCINSACLNLDAQKSEADPDKKE